MRLKGIKVVVKPDGKRYVYRRVSGGLVRLPDLPENDPAFIRAYIEAGQVEVQPRSRATPGSIAALCEAWISSPAYKRLAPSTRAVFRRVAERIRVERGKGLVKDLRPEHLRRDLRDMTPGAASNRYKVWRALMRYAIDEGWITIDPSTSVRRPRGVITPHRQWTSEDVATYRAFWPIGTRERLAFEVIAWTAARCVDAVRLGHQYVGEDGWLRFEQAKTGQPVALPVTAPLPSWAAPFAEEREMLLACLPQDRLLWITTKYGKPRSIKGLSQWMSAAARSAGLPAGSTAHGIRKYRAARLAEIGASAHQIGAWIGDVSLGMVSHYTRAADRKAILEGTEQDRNFGNSMLRVSKIPKKSSKNNGRN